MRRIALMALLLAACAEKESSIQSVKLPFEAAVPFAARGGVISFIDEKTKEFSFVHWHDGEFSTPQTIAGGPDMLINRADYPSIWVDGDTLVATWSTKKEHGTVVHVAKSIDGGGTWSQPRTPHPDLISAFGFTALAGDDMVYLDGRKLEGGMEGTADMELRAGDGTALDPRVCDCCQTSIAMTAEGPVVAYRDRSAEEIRDISIVRRTASGWTQPKTLHADGWKIVGCPVNGPQLDADGRRVVAAWFTAVNDEPRVYVAFSEDAGATFGRPIRVDAGDVTGHVDTVLLEDGSAAVTWTARQLHVRRVRPDGTLGKPLDLGESRGFPSAARWGENVAVVWSRTDGAHLAVIERL